MPTSYPNHLNQPGRAELEEVMTGLGYTRRPNGLFGHPESEFVVDFEPGPVAVGRETLTEWHTLETDRGQLVLLSSTQSVKDRLAWFYIPTIDRLFGKQSRWRETRKSISTS